MLQEKAWNFDIAFTHACSIFSLLAAPSLQAVPRRPAILVPCRLQCQLYSSQSSTAEILMSCQNLIRQFPARQSLLCGYGPCMHLWSVDQQEDLCFVLGLRGWQFFLKDPCAVVKRRTLDPGPALLWRPCCYRSCHFILRCWENHLSWCTLDEALKHRFLCAFCDFSTSHLTHPFAQIPGCGRRLWSCDCTSRRQSQAQVLCLYVVLLSSRDITRIGTV